MIDKTFCNAVVRAAKRIQEARDEKDTCPRDTGGCGRSAALYSVSRRGITCGKFCGYCGWSSLFLAVDKHSTKVVKSRAKVDAKAKTAAKVKARKKAGAQWAQKRAARIDKLQAMEES